MASEIKVDTISEKTSAGGVTIDGLLIKDGGISGDVSLIGTTPTFTIGDAGAEDATLLFDGNAQDFHIGLDDTADDLVIGVGSTLGTTTAIAIDENANTTFSGTVTVGVNDTGKDVKLFGATSGSYWLWDESADGVVAVSNLQQTGTITVGVDNTGHDVKLFGATSGSYALWDESADDLNLIASGLGITTAKDLGAGIHIRTSDSSATAQSNYDELIIESSGNAGISILTGTSNYGGIMFGDSGDDNAGQINYYHSDNAMSFATSGALTMKIDSTGAITKPLQPCVLVRNGSAQTDIAVDTATTVEFDTERFDQNADFNTGTYTFTAPVTGRYLISSVIVLNQLDTSATYYRTRFITSNYSYKHSLWDPDYYDADHSYWTVAATIIADMDASDTVYIDFIQAGGAQQADTIANDCTFSIGLFA